MSGLAGIVHWDRAPVDAAQLHRMLDALQTRGLHARNLFIAGGVGLGQSILQPDPFPPGKSLPLVHPNQRWVLVFEGRIDNRLELLNRLKIQQASMDLVGDGQLVLGAYEKWGQACLKHLIGDYALAIWDCQEKQLFCGRDHFGVKPLYYVPSGPFFLFASTPDAILATRKFQPQLNPGRIADFFFGWEGEDTTSTFYQGLYRLPPGHALSISASSVRLERYWELTPDETSQYKTEGAYLEEFQHRFTQAVRCRLRNPANTAVSLSGGLDSSAIFGVVRNLEAQGSQTPLPSYSLISPQDPKNLETQFINTLLKQDGSQGITISFEQNSQWMDHFATALAQLGEPFDWHMNIWHALYSQAHAHHIQAVLDGVDGDLLLADTGLIQILWQSGQYRDALRETLFAQGLMTFYVRPWRLFLRSLRAAYTPLWLRRFAEKISQPRTIPRAMRRSLINPDFARSIDLEERLVKFHSYDVPLDVPTQVEAHRISINHPHLQAALERYHRVASAYAIEPLHPLLDLRLVEFCLRLPWQLKTRRGWTKMAMRRMMEPLLPPEVVWRKDKHHLGWSLNLEILKSQADYFRQVLEDNRPRLQSYIDYHHLDQCWTRFMASGEDHQASMLWEALALAFWLQRQDGMRNESIKACAI